MGKKILDINPYPVARAYTYHAYPLSILSSKKYVGEKKIELLIEGKTSDFEVETVNSRYDITDNIFTLTADDYAEDVKLVINYSSLKLFERAFKIIYFQYTQPCAYLAITILDKYSSKEKANVYLYRNESISSTGWNNLNTMNKTLKKIEGFKFRINKNDVVFEILKDGEECEKLHTKLDKTYKDYSINITAFLGENQYYNWFFSNYIQLYGRNIFSVEYFNDYFIAPERKNSLMYTIHSFLANFVSSVCVFRLHRCEHIASSVYGYGSSV